MDELKMLPNWQAVASMLLVLVITNHAQGRCLFQLQLESRVRMRVPTARNEPRIKINLNEYQYRLIAFVRPVVLCGSLVVKVLGYKPGSRPDEVKF
jgi:hypothetical protein